MHFEDYISSPSRCLKLEPKHYEAVKSSQACRTEKLGVEVHVCTLCGEVVEIRRSCKHRFCATCGASMTYKWGEGMLSRLMNISHHHVVMTLPKSYRKLSQMNGDKLHNELFRVSAKVLKDWFAEHYGLRIGIVSVLHTSGSDLKYHPHVHMIVSRGGQDLLSGEYRSLPGGKYLAKNEDLGRLLRLRYESVLLKLYRQEDIRIYKKLKDVASFSRWMTKQKMKHWIVSVQEALSDINSIVGYVGRYTKRACISEYKLLEVSDDVIRFRYKDYKQSKRGEAAIESELSLSPTEFLDRLLLHVPNKGYRMVRYYGLYNSYYLKKIPSSMKLDTESETAVNEEFEGNEWGEYEELRKSYLRSGKPDPLYCYSCEEDRVLYAIRFEHKLIQVYENYEEYEDSS